MCPSNIFFCRLLSCKIPPNPLIYASLVLPGKLCKANLLLNAHGVLNIMPNTAITNLKEIQLLPAVKDLKSFARKHYCTTPEVS